MSRGAGRVEQAVLELLKVNPCITPMMLAELLCAEQPTASDLTSIRRALRNLVAKGQARQGRARRYFPIDG
jgi:hypothetical protein